MSGFPSLRAGDVHVGDRLPTLHLEMFATRIVAGALATRDFMPVHHDHRYAQKQGSPDIFQNILSDTAYCSRFLTDWAGPEAMVRKLAIRLGVPTFPDSTLTFDGEVTDVAHVDGEVAVHVTFRGVNELGDHVSGTAEVRLPAEPHSSLTHVARADTVDGMSDIASSVIQVVPIGFQWPTVDPYLFCVHHLDHYPAGNDDLGPAASLDGREIGSDFAGVDGWRMYHGSTVPGFPQHPHRGFETVTFVRQGLIDHSDSLGATARFGRGDVQWLTAGNGIVHCEMFPLLDRDAPNTCELFQIWMNLPASDKMADPHFTMLWDHDIPRVRTVDADGRATVVTIVAGAIGDHVPPSPPPNSWASRPEADVAIWHIDGEAGAAWTLPAARGADTVRTLYVFGGSATIDGVTVESEHAAVVRCDVPVELTAGPSGMEILVLQGRPIGEPVVSHGPFVMNTREEIVQAFEDYRRTGFGGWPWPVDDPVHHRDAGRFADRGSGDVEHAGAAGPPAAVTS